MTDRHRLNRPRVSRSRFCSTRRPASSAARTSPGVAAGGRPDRAVGGYWTGEPRRGDGRLHLRAERAAWSSTGGMPISSDGPDGTADPRLLVDVGRRDPIKDWEVRWDPSGRYLGVWIADSADGGLGRLSLLAIDRTTGKVDPDHKQTLRARRHWPGSRSRRADRLGLPARPGRRRQPAPRAGLEGSRRRSDAVGARASKEDIVVVREIREGRRRRRHGPTGGPDRCGPVRLGPTPVWREPARWAKVRPCATQDHRRGRGAHHRPRTGRRTRFRGFSDPGSIRASTGSGVPGTEV